jgi:competence protein ComEA
VDGTSGTPLKRCPRCDRRFPIETEYCAKDGTILYVEGAMPPLPPKRDKRGRLLEPPVPGLDVEFTPTDPTGGPLAAPGAPIANTSSYPAGSVSGPALAAVPSAPGRVTVATSTPAGAPVMTPSGTAMVETPAITALAPVPVAAPAPTAVTAILAMPPGSMPGTTSGPLTVPVIFPAAAPAPAPAARALPWVLPAAVTMALLLGAGIAYWIVSTHMAADDAARGGAVKIAGQPDDEGSAERDAVRAPRPPGNAGTAGTGAAETAAAVAPPKTPAPAPHHKPAAAGSAVAVAPSAPAVVTPSTAAARPGSAEASAAPHTVVLHASAGAPAAPASASAAPAATAAAAIAPAASAAAKASGAVVHLNSATQAELESLPGIGPAKARAILEFRETNGGFKSVDELVKVKGIGPKTMEALRPRVAL